MIMAYTKETENLTVLDGIIDGFLTIMIHVGLVVLALEVLGYGA